MHHLAFARRVEKAWCLKASAEFSSQQWIISFRWKPALRLKMQIATQYVAYNSYNANHEVINKAGLCVNTDWTAILDMHPIWTIRCQIKRTILHNIIRQTHTHIVCVEPDRRKPSGNRWATTPVKPNNTFFPSSGCWYNVAPPPCAHSLAAK